MGKKPTTLESLISLRLSDELLQRIDQWRRRQTVPPTRQAAVRHMLDQYLRRLGEEPDRLARHLAPPTDRERQARRKARKGV
jgi:hypothetical protein